LSTLKFDRTAHQITLTRQDGSAVGTWAAANNPSSGSKSFPNGTWPYAYHKDHPEDPGPDSAYGSYGIFVFTVPNRTGLGVHSGRANVPDGLGRKGPYHATNGCIRTTDDATQAILNLNDSDTLETLTVLEGAVELLARRAPIRKRAKKPSRKKAASKAKKARKKQAVRGRQPKSKRASPSTKGKPASKTRARKK
jgi:hypothetical protein